MPQIYNAAVVTNLGLDLLRKAQAGECKLEITKIAVGSGQYNEEEKTVQELRRRSLLKEEKNRYGISNKEREDEYVKVTAFITNQDPITHEVLVSEGYYINEIGLFAKESGSDEDEILYSIAIASDEHGDYMPAYNGYNPAQIIQDYCLTISNNAEIVISANLGAAALADDLLQRISVGGQTIHEGAVRALNFIGGENMNVSKSDNSTGQEVGIHIEADVLNTLRECAEDTSGKGIAGATALSELNDSLIRNLALGSVQIIAESNALIFNFKVSGVTRHLAIYHTANANSVIVMYDENWSTIWSIHKTT